MAQTRTSTPRRGTRPSNRRDLILGAARELFHRKGYDHVGVGDIADAVAIGPSALYRHFEGKQQLLADVLEREHTLLMESMDRLDLDNRDRAASGLAALGMQFRGGSVLIQREARHLPDDLRDAVRDRSREIGRRLFRIVRACRPDLDDAATDLLAWAVLGIVSSPSLHRLDGPQTDLEGQLRELLTRALDSTIPAGFALQARPTTPPVTPQSRRENLLNEAVRLFATHGYANVAVEDVGATLGISGPSVYNHVPTKLDLLRVPMTRGIAYLMMDLGRAFDGARDPDEVLHRLIRSHVDFAVAHSYLLELLFTEAGHLPDDVAGAFRRAQREYLQEWGELLRRTTPGLDVTAARIRVQTTVAMVGDVVRIKHLRHASQVDAALVGLCDGLLLS